MVQRVGTSPELVQYINQNADVWLTITMSDGDWGTYVSRRPKRLWICEVLAMVTLKPCTPLRHWASCVNGRTWPCAGNGNSKACGRGGLIVTSIFANPSSNQNLEQIDMLEAAITVGQSPLQRILTLCTAGYMVKDKKIPTSSQPNMYRFTETLRTQLERLSWREQ